MIYSAVTCYEEHGTAKENILEDHTECDVVLRCAYADRWSLVNDLIGNNRPWPHLTGWEYVPYARTAGIVPDLTSYVTIGQGCSYVDALVTVSYSNALTASGNGAGANNDGGMDLFSESLEGTVEFSKLDYRQFRWSNGDPLLEGEAPGRQVRGLNLMRTVYKVRPPLSSSLLTLGGFCNRVAYRSRMLGLTFDAETLIFNPPKMNRKMTTAGSDGIDVSLQFNVNPNGWNRYWRASTGTFERIYNVDGSIYYNYPLGDFGAFLF